LARAREAGLDLVEVSPNSRPPVCRIMDYGKWKYAQKKKERKAKAHRHETELKEVRIRTPKISKHDLEIKSQRAREFLERGDRVQFTLRFRGREMAHVDLGQEVLASIKLGLADIAKVERDFRMEGKRLSMVLAPIAGAKPQHKPAAPKKPQPAGVAAQSQELDEPDDVDDDEDDEGQDVQEPEAPAPASPAEKPPTGPAEANAPTQPSA
jgi:translation initiation factor IF-3